MFLPPFSVQWLPAWLQLTQNGAVRVGRENEEGGRWGRGRVRGQMGGGVRWGNRGEKV